MIKQIAIERPQNLIKFSESLALNDSNDNGAKSIEMTTFKHDNQLRCSPTVEMSAGDIYEIDESRETSPNSGGKMSLCQYLSDIFWKLFSMRPTNPLISTIAKGLYLN